MPRLHELRSQLLNDGRITDDEVELIQRHIVSDGQLDLDDVRFLVELLADADEVCPAFDELFFPVLKAVLLDDGRIGPDEQYYLVKMLYADGHIRDSEKQFLRELRSELREPSPEFEQLCETAFAAHPTNWDVGGCRR
jgi:hypothetical protein